jgi:hypothetical protein
MLSNETSVNFRDGMSKFVHPIQYMKWRMERIDHARETYEQCSMVFEKNPLFVNGSLIQLT